MTYRDMLIQSLRDIADEAMLYGDDHRHVVELCEQAAAEIERLRAIPGLAGVIDGEAVIVPKEANGEMIKLGVDYRLKTAISMHNRWPDDTANLWSAMAAASPYARRK